MSAVPPNPAVQTVRLTVSQAVVRFLQAQFSERDGVRQQFFGGVFGIFGHGNVAGVGQALRQYADVLPYHMARNEQSMVHIASGYAKQRNRLATFACTSSIGTSSVVASESRTAGSASPSRSMTVPEMRFAGSCRADRADAALICDDRR